MPEFWSNVGSIFWYTLTIIIFVSYLMVLFNIVIDVFRDRELNGGVRAVWVIALIFFPVITALIYLIVRGRGMGQRAAVQAERNKAAADEYIRSVAGSPADEIARAKALLDAGTISNEEYSRLKAKALA
ncbi:PLDc N-terminal domain-containing protein [Micropruina sp.]|uniref:PLDc N-terminal domain-containing protein n=1 Tax=Micropruina sp. TaxID=2737536 RepID=UPI0039E56707